LALGRYAISLAWYQLDDERPKQGAPAAGGVFGFKADR
jgi:hypothetical protein